MKETSVFTASQTQFMVQTLSKLQEIHINTFYWSAHSGHTDSSKIT